MNILSLTYRSPDPVSGFDGLEISDENENEDDDGAQGTETLPPVEAYLQWLNSIEIKFYGRPTPFFPATNAGRTIRKTCHSAC
jgi:hypothetical protein